MSFRGSSAVTLGCADSDQEPLISERDSATPLPHGRRPLVRKGLMGHGVPQRVAMSLMPPLVYPEYRRVYSDLKGPLLVVTTLAAIILYGLHDPRQSLVWELVTTLRLTVCYWLGFSLLAFLMGRCFSTSLSLTQLLSLAGYSLTGHCLVLFGAELLHQEESHTVFFLLTIVFGGFATGRLVLLVLFHTPQPPHRLLLGSSLASIHLMHLIYIHFACMRRKFSVWGLH